ncbi:MAG: translation initiation factor IF-2 subunit gamma [Candidatus Micrarchaeales archaeon]|jgi:Translation initiation factor 2, gamma subunit (eIF-2gamma; GTPase)|uniref:protein-synthesizing GTPase n=1 Tax=Candidatus Micrarchaeum acidiphilum ARMAN-2 TaxID=425595 RepID=C7DGB8_MICA2|nr:MAG: protein synthesis factor GTP-binding [Candidatus Micrarchaeum acidiphilum ARMAN-2]MCW6161142.1 translation initiation factor IF-2 subunit gamma [Candidatus Micrarchaeales archaeon]
MKQSMINIGTLGHIDHGKTSLVKAITNIWTDRHSESIKRNMTIKLGYADAIIKKCEHCEGAEAYTIGDRCEHCEGVPKPVVRISILDAPGHETLMATAIAGANIINAILFVIAANEPCPMQQTREHLMIINLLGIKNVIVVQTKVDIVGKEAAIAHYKQIREFLKGSIIENAQIVPVMTNRNINIDELLKLIAEIPLPKHDLSAEPLMYIARSFDINKPGTRPGGISGGVIGGTIVKGVFRKGDKIEIRPGINMSHSSKKETYKPIVTVITGISSGTSELDEAVPGGLIGISTELDPSYTKADGLVGNVAGHIGGLPESALNLGLKYYSMNRKDIEEKGFSENEPVILSVGTLTVVGYVRSSKKNMLKVELKHPVCAEPGSKIAVMRNVSQRWKLTGYALMQ